MTDGQWNSVTALGALASAVMALVAARDQKWDRAAAEATVCLLLVARWGQEARRV